MKEFTKDQKIKSLSWKQPFAELMLHGKIETRTWQAKYRGWVLICMSKKQYKSSVLIETCGYDQLQRIREVLPLGPIPGGNAIAIGRLVDCRPMKEDDEDACFVKFKKGLYCHVYENVQPIKPFKWTGTLSMPDVPDEFKELIEPIN